MDLELLDERTDDPVSPAVIEHDAAGDAVALGQGIDGNGGLTVNLPRAGRLRLAHSRLRCVDLIDCKNLECLDLSALQHDVHLTARGCPQLRHIELPPSGRAHVHIDSGERPPAIVLSGGVEQVDACWLQDGRAGRMLERLPGRGGIFKGVRLVPGAHDSACTCPQHPSSPRPGAAELVVVIGAVPGDPGSGMLELSSSGSTGGARHVCLIDVLPEVRHLVWRGGRLRSLKVLRATELQTMRTEQPIVDLTLFDCPQLRCVTSEDQPCRNLSIQGTGVEIGNESVHPLNESPAPTGRARLERCAALTVDVPCEVVTIADLPNLQRLKVYHPGRIALLRCPALRHARIDPASEMRCEGTAPLNLIGQPMHPGLKVLMDEGVLARFRTRVAQGSPKAWDQFVNALQWCGAGRFALAALLALETLRGHGVSAMALWEARMDLYRTHHNWLSKARAEAEPNPSGDLIWFTESAWQWRFPADRADEAHRADLLLWLGVSAQPSAVGFGRQAAHGFIEGTASGQTRSVWPWLLERRANEPGVAVLTRVVLREATKYSAGDAEFRRRFTAGLRHFVQRQHDLHATWEAESPGVMNAVTEFFLERGSGRDIAAALQALSNLNRTAAQTWAAQRLRTDALRGHRAETATLRAMLAQLMLVGQVHAVHR